MNSYTTCRPGLLCALAAGLLVVACGGAPEQAGDGPESRDSGQEPAGGSASSSTADSLVDAWIRAAGGASAWDSVRKARYTVTTVWFDSAGEVERMRPRRVEFRKSRQGFQARIERPEAEGLYVQTFTGDTAWATLNGRPLPPDDPAAAESEYVGRDVFYWIGLPWKLRDPGVNLEARELDGGGFEVKVTFGGDVGAHPGDRYFYRFVDEDPFPEEVHYIEQGYGEEARSRTIWKHFRRAGPITYVGTRLYPTEEGRPRLELRIDDVVINPELPDSLFAPPARRGGG